MSVDALLAEAKGLDPGQLRTLVLNLTDLMDGSSRSEVSSILESRRRAVEMKSGAEKGLSHEETFARARAALKA